MGGSGKIKGAAVRSGPAARDSCLPRLWQSLSLSFSLVAFVSLSWYTIPLNCIAECGFQCDERSKNSMAEVDWPLRNEIGVNAD